MPTEVIEISAIDQKYAELGGERGSLGYPIEDEKPNPDGRGRRRRFQGGYIYWSPTTGAHEIHGNIYAKWKSLGWERSILGYPTSDEQNAPGGGRISYFEHGSIRWRRFAAPLSFVQQNMALLPAPAPYKGTERGQAIRALIDHLCQEQPNVVGLSEVFVDGERDKIKGDLRTIYPYSVEGPDESDLESDGGLLLLSKHPIIAKHQTIYRQCAGVDCFANKGALHARIQVSGHPTLYDVFLSHTQDPNAGGKGAGRDEVQAQLTHLASFVRAYSSPQYPTLLMGDLNTNALTVELYSDLKNRLNYSQDLWTTSGNGSAGITSGDPANSFSPDKPPRSVDDPGRHHTGSRIDYSLSWFGPQFWPIYSNTKVLVWQSSSGRDISDHYGLKTQQTDIQELKATVNRSIHKVTVTLSRFHCLEETDEVGSDEVYFRLYYQTANGANGNKGTSVKEDTDKGEIHTYSSPVILSFGDPGAWLDLTVQGWEEDDWPNNDDGLGSTKIHLERSELLELLGRSTPRVLPLLTGDGGEYAMTVNITVE